MNDALATQTALNALGRVESLAAKLGAAEAIEGRGFVTGESAHGGPDHGGDEQSGCEISVHFEGSPGNSS